MKYLYRFFVKLIATLSLFIYPPKISEKVSYTLDKIYGYRLSRFVNLGEKFIINRYITIAHGENIVIGNYARIFKDVIIATHPLNNHIPKIIIGDGCYLGESTHITCCNRIEIGNHLLTGRRVTITDNSHGQSTITDLMIPPLQRTICSKGIIKIGNNVWLGDNVIVLPNVVIGDGCIVGANTVVTNSIPPYCVAVGNPMRIIKRNVCDS